MPEEIEDVLHELTEEFWLNYSTLVNKVLERAPDAYRDELAMRLQEKSNVYGRDDDA